MQTSKLLALSAFFAGLAVTPVPAQAPSHGPVLVELFTSQGCSSCPSAERWLSTQGMELFQQGRILPLAFHVAYWNYLGWKDPFSSTDFTDRQGAYAGAWKSDQVYTPQMVVAGSVGFVGSDGDRALQEIANYQGTAEPLPFACSIGSGGKEVLVQVGKMPAGSKVYCALFENGLTTPVEKGENAGAILQEDFVVRSFLPLDHPGTALPLPPDTRGRLSNLGVAVFAQDPQSLAVRATGFVYPLSRAIQN